MKRLSPFAQKVLSVVARIPLGQTRTYKWVAAKAGSPRGARAVGQILKRNPWTIIIPCHRVIESDDKPGGYSGGIKKKLMLLALEREIKSCLENKE